MNLKTKERKKSDVYFQQLTLQADTAHSGMLTILLRMRHVNVRGVLVISSQTEKKKKLSQCVLRRGSFTPKIRGVENSKGPPPFPLAYTHKHLLIFHFILLLIYSLCDNPYWCTQTHGSRIFLRNHSCWGCPHFNHSFSMSKYLLMTRVSNFLHIKQATTSWHNDGTIRLLTKRDDRLPIFIYSFMLCTNLISLWELGVYHVKDTLSVASYLQILW